MSHLFITLVHGTWGRGILPDQDANLSKRTDFWFSNESRFCCALRRELEALGNDVSVQSLDWSGANSIHSRAGASVKLAELIDATSAKSPEARQVIIGHSHGGNVALLAQRHLRHANVTPLIATLATPFVDIVRRPSKKTEKAFLALLSILAAIAFFLFAMDFSYQLGSLGELVILFSPILLPVPLYFLLRRVILDGKRADLEVATRYDWASTKNLLVLRAVGDEAALALAAGSIAHRLSSVCSWLFLIFHALVLCAFGLLMYALLQAISAADGGAEFWLLAIGAALIFSDASEYVVTTFIFIIIAFSLSGGAFKTVFGRELFWGSLATDVRTYTEPENVENLTVSTLRHDPEALKGLSHSLYDHPDAPKAIALWAHQQVAASQSITSAGSGACPAGNEGTPPDLQTTTFRA